MTSDQPAAIIAIGLDAVLAVPTASPPTSDESSRHTVTLRLPGRTGHHRLARRHGAWLREIQHRGATLLLAGPDADAALVSQHLQITDRPASLPGNRTPSGERFGRSVLAAAVAAHVPAAVPLAVISDSYGGKDHTWARRRTAVAGAPALLRAAHPTRGLCRSDIVAVHDWLDTLPDPAGHIRPRQPVVVAPLTGLNGNVFAVIHRARRALRGCGYGADAEHLTRRLADCDSYDAALAVIATYVVDGGPNSHPDGVPLP